MPYLDAVVYEPPSEDFPALAVVFKPDGEILAAHAAVSVGEAQAFLERILKEIETRMSTQSSGTAAPPEQID